MGFSDINSNDRPPCFERWYVQSFEANTGRLNLLNLNPTQGVPPTLCVGCCGSRVGKARVKVSKGEQAKPYVGALNPKARCAGGSTLGRCKRGVDGKRLPAAKEKPAPLPVQSGLRKLQAKPNKPIP